MFGNPQLCYTGNFSNYLADPSATQCISARIPPRRDPQLCSKSKQWLMTLHNYIVATIVVVQ